jgi:hypothetical protein
LIIANSSRKPPFLLVFGIGKEKRPIKNEEISWSRQMVLTGGLEASSRA